MHNSNNKSKYIAIILIIPNNSANNINIILSEMQYLTRILHNHYKLYYTIHCLRATAVSIYGNCIYPFNEFEELSPNYHSCLHSLDFLFLYFAALLSFILHRASEHRVSRDTLSMHVRKHVRARMVLRARTPT